MPYSLAIAKLSSSHTLSMELMKDAEFLSITKTKEELSVVCPEDVAPAAATIEPDWRCLKVEGPLDFGLTGILSSLLEPLAKAKIGIFTISTFDTDYILVKKENLRKTIAILATFCTIKEVFS